MNSFRSGLLAGLIAGAAIAGSVALVLRPRPEPAPVPAPPPAPLLDAAAALKEENRVLKEKVAELEKAKAAAPAPRPEEKAPAAEKPSSPDFKERFANLAELGLGAFQSPKFKETLDALKEAGKPGLDYLSGVLKTSKSATERFMAAALMEGAGDADAVDALAFALQSDGDDLVRRMASHALASLKAPAAEAPLRAATAEDSDWGVRVNSAYGLAKLGKDDGLKMLRESYESPDTPAEYRLPILGGLADVAAPSTAPLFRRILADTKDLSYQLMSIGALEKMKDLEAIPVLQKIVDSSQPDMVKQAAAKAIDAIKK